MEILFFFFVSVALLLAAVNLVVLVSLANFLIRLGDSHKKFIAEHQEFQQSYYDFMAEVRSKKGLVELVNRVMPRP